MCCQLFWWLHFIFTVNWLRLLSFFLNGASFLILDLDADVDLYVHYTSVVTAVINTINIISYA